MADLVSSISSASAAWGQPKKQAPESQAATSAAQESSASSSPAPNDTGTASTQPSTNQTSAPSASTTQASPSSPGATSGRATAAVSTATYSETAEVSRMPERLRELIVQQRINNSPAATVLRMFAGEMAADRIVAKELPVEETALVQRTIQQLIEQPSRALVAQANHTRESVQALLELE